MNLFKYKFLFLVLALLWINACSEVLDIKNPAAFDSGATWKDGNLANAYLNGLYASAMPSGWPGGLYTDEKVGSVLNQNSITVTSHPWSGSFSTYTTIRKINILLEEIDKGNLDSSLRNTIVGQALFLRAYSYFSLLRVFGGVPLLKKAQTLEDDLQVERDSSRTVFKAIYEDLDSSIQLLKNQPFANGDKGRIGQAAAYAFKGRVALYKASPFFHPTSPHTNADWDDALKYTKEAKDKLDAMGIFGLNPDYGRIWSVSNEGNPEAILTVKFTAPQKTNGRQEFYTRPGRATQAFMDNPTWNLVKAYPMADGSKFDPTKLDQYWVGRDQRFYATVVYNGVPFEFAGSKQGARLYSDGTQPSPVALLQNAYFDNNPSGGLSGFFTKKGLQLDLPLDQLSQNSVDWIEIRYAEVLLNYAEAANEKGDQTKALQLLKQIRKRAGIKTASGEEGGYASEPTTQEEVRKAIYDERFVEFAFEGQRFWDLKRSRTLKDLNSTTIAGVHSTLKTTPKDDTKAANSEYLPEDFTYTITDPILNQNEANVKFVIDEKTIDFAPIPTAEIQKNPKLEQNKAWGGKFNPTLDIE